MSDRPYQLHLLRVEARALLGHRAVAALEVPLHLLVLAVQLRLQRRLLQRQPVQPLLQRVRQKLLSSRAPENANTSFS